MQLFTQAILSILHRFSSAKRGLLAFGMMLALCGTAMAQTGFDAGGGSVKSAEGSVSVSFGQAICLYPDDGRYVDVQGVQQPYECTKTYVGDTVRDVEECDSYHFKTKTFSLMDTGSESFPTLT